MLINCIIYERRTYYFTDLFFILKVSVIFSSSVRALVYPSIMNVLFIDFKIIIDLIGVIISFCLIMI